ncbi:exopolyphosphatase [Furfurilactobacillus sp. WILCCON 0119]|uniref:Ppx/GppA phosphatase family protein n=1 Tax=Furfurilactobacillus entadae TaxID=2922307 RepID=UPI0035E5AB92
MAKEKLYGAMVISAQDMQLMIVELKTQRVLERVSAPLYLGADLFEGKRIEPERADDVVTILERFLQLLKDYNVTNYRLVASHTIARAENIDYIRDHIYITTGITLHFMTVNEESLFSYEAAADLLPNFHQLISDRTLLIQVGASMAHFMIFVDGRLTLTRELFLGPLQVANQLQGLEHRVESYQEVLSDYLHSKLVSLYQYLPEQTFDQVILMGSKLNLLEGMIPTNQRYVKLSHADFEQQFQTVIQMTPQDLLNQSNLPTAEVNEVLPLFLLLDEVFDHFEVKTIHLTDFKLIDGCVLDAAASQATHAHNDDAISQVMLSSAYELARRFHVDEAHQQSVVMFATQLFDRLKKLHGLGARERLLLQLAAILQDTGLFIDSEQHAFHSEYIVNHSEMLGLRADEQIEVAAIARYHSSETVSADLSQFGIAMNNRLVMVKLAAILRLADALDDSRLHKISKISVSIKKPTITIRATANDDIELETWTFNKKRRFFEEIYGLTPVLQRTGRF